MVCSVAAFLPVLWNWWYWVISVV